MGKRSISVLALCAQLMLFIALSSDGAEGLLERNWRQCVYRNLNDGRNTGLIKVWISAFSETKLCKQLYRQMRRVKESFCTRGISLTKLSCC